MESQDRRIRRTQNLLAKALIEVTLKKGYEAVTVRDITERADVGYATFYRHYQDKDALLEDVLDVVLTDMISLFFPDASANTSAEKLGTLLFTYVKDNFEIMKVLLSSRKTSVIGKRMIEGATHNINVRNTPRSDSLIPPEIASYHLATSAINLIEWWLEAGMPYPPEQMAQIYADLIQKPTLELAFKPRNR